MQKESWGKLDKKEMALMDAIMLLDDLIDASDPDVSSVFERFFSMHFCQRLPGD